MSLPPREAPRAVQLGRRLVIALLLMLILLGLAWELALAPTGRGTWAIKVLPLLACLPGLARHRLHTYRALSLLVWLYVTEGLVRATTEGGAGQRLAIAELALALLLFAACVHYIRLRLPRRSKKITPPAYTES